MLQEILSKCSFSKSLSPGKNWKSKSMRIIPEEFLRSNRETIEHRVVFSVPWNNSWQLWLHLDKKGLFMIEEDWNEFVDDNLLGPDDILVFTHKDTMYFDVRIFKIDGKEPLSPPLKVEPETEPVHPEPQNSHQETTTPASASASGRKTSRGRQSCAHVENPKQYLSNPKNPYFEKKLTKTNTILYVSPVVIDQYSLEFGPRNSTMYFLLPNGKKLKGFAKCYSGLHGFLGWANVCQNCNLKPGDTVVCEFELSGRVIIAVRVHFVNETTTPASASASRRKTSRGRQSCAHVENPKQYLSNPKNPYFEKKLTKTNTILYVSPVVIDQYGLEFGPRNSTMYFLLPNGKKVKGFAKCYNGLHGFLRWANVCQNCNLKPGDTVVCEFELSGRVIIAVRVHFVNETTTPASASASGRKTSRGRQSCAHVENPKRYLSNPKNPYFEKKLTKTNHILYVSPSVIDQYGLEFGPRNSTMYFLLPDGKRLKGFAKCYSGLHGFLGWADVCQNYNLKLGDTVVCEFELSGRVITAVRVHFVNE